MTNQVLRHALEYAGRGWPVFPCQHGGKAPATRHGYRDATTDPEQVSWWFGRHPELNLAIATGAPGPDILDIDQRGEAGDGYPSLARLEAAGLLSASSGTVRTPSGGMHLYFTGTTQRSGHLPACHIDFLATGGYALAPPSQLKGEPYRHVTGFAGHGELHWQAVLAILDPSRAALQDREPRGAGPRGPASGEPGQRDHAPRPGGPRVTRIDRLARWVAAQPESNRNNGLFWAANRALEADQAADLSLLAAAARQTGLSEPEITRTLQSARRTSQAKTSKPDTSRTLQSAQARPERDDPQAEGAS